MAQAAAGVAQIAGPVVGVAGGIIEARGQLRQAKDEAASLRFQAQNVEAEGVDRIVDLERERATMAGAQRAAFGASGVKVQVGSPLAVLAETHYRADIQRSRLTQTTQNQAAVLRTQARGVEKLGQTRYTTTLLNTFGNLVKQGAQVAGAAGGGGGGAAAAAGGGGGGAAAGGAA